MKTQMDETEMKRLCNKHGIRFPYMDEKILDSVKSYLCLLLELAERLERLEETKK